MTALMTWLTPASGPTRDQLAATIDRLAAEHNAPRFQPHVTALVTFDTAENEATQTLASLVADVPPFDLTFTAIGHEQTYSMGAALGATGANDLPGFRTKMNS